MSNDENRREFTRVLVSLKVELSAEDKTSICGIAENLSLNGVYLECTGKLPLGTSCEVQLELDGGGIKLDISGQVSRDTEKGLGIEFTGVALDDLEHLRNLIRYNTDDIDKVEAEFGSHIGLKPRDNG
ncbi:MAG: PilZ domain-containing protein [Myxococcota bacterium]|nr:PilZ domain-containing protein [Myxococcota bacterium]